MLTLHQKKFEGSQCIVNVFEIVPKDLTTYLECFKVGCEVPLDDNSFLHSYEDNF